MLAFDEFKDMKTVTGDQADPYVIARWVEETGGSRINKIVKQNSVER